MYGTNKKVSSSSPQTKKRTTPPRNDPLTRRQDASATAAKPPTQPRFPASDHAPYFGNPRHDPIYPIVPSVDPPPPHPFEKKAGPKTGFTIIPSLPDSIGGAASRPSPPSASSAAKNYKKPNLPPYMMNHPWPGVDGGSIYTPSSSLPSPYHPPPVSTSLDDDLRNPSRYTAMPSWTGTGFNSQQV